MTHIEQFVVMGASAFCVVAAVKSSNSSLLPANSSLKKGVDSAIQLRDLVDGDKGSSETAVEEANISPQLTLLVGHLWTQTFGLPAHFLPFVPLSLALPALGGMSYAYGTTWWELVCGPHSIAGPSSRFVIHCVRILTYTRMYAAFRISRTSYYLCRSFTRS